MIPYWTLFGLFVVAALFYEPRQQAARLAASSPANLVVTARQDRRNVSPLFWFAGLCVTVMIGLRYRVGVDWVNYVHIYYAELPWDSFAVTWGRGDPLFYIPMWLFAASGIEIWAFLLVCAAIFTAGLFAFASRQVNPWLAILVAVPYLIIVVAMSGVRQATALGFVFFALVAFSERSMPRFLAWMACAAACHASAILLVPIAALSFTRKRVEQIFLILLSLAIGNFVLGSTFEVYAGNYLQQTVESAGAIYRIGMNLIAGVLFIFLRKSLPFKEAEDRLWMNFSILAVASLALYFVMSSSTALDRLALYLFPLQIAVLSAVPNVGSSGANHRMFPTLMLTAYLGLILYVFLNYATNRDPHIPYRFWPTADKIPGH
jgi:hypothetical protein